MSRGSPKPLKSMAVEGPEGLFAITSQQARSIDPIWAPRLTGPMWEFLTSRVGQLVGLEGGLAAELAVGEALLAPLEDPGSRLFYLNLAASLFLVVLYFLISGKRPVRAGLRLIFRVRYWWNRSTRADYQIYALNAAIKILLFVPFLDFGYRFSQWTVQGLLFLRGDFVGLAPTFMGLLAMTVFSFVWDDFLRFAHHKAMHKISWLWPYHAVHHSARVLTPMTLYRTHPVESALAALRNSLSLGVSTGLFLFLFDGRFTLITFFGVNLFGQVFNFLGANLRHSHIPLSFGFFERVFISPLQHQIHHSREARDHGQNFGVSLAVWDTIGGTLATSKSLGERRLRFGLSGPFESRTSRLLLDPVLNSLSKASQVSVIWSVRLSQALGAVTTFKNLTQKSLKNEKSDRSPLMSNRVLSRPLAHLSVNPKTLAAFVLVVGGALLFASQSFAALTVYTDRPAARLQPIADEFTQATGEKVVILEQAYPKILAQLKSEGTTSPADVVFVKDLVFLAELSNLGWFQPMTSTVVEQSVAAQMRDSKLLWTAITIRGRTIVYDSTRVQPSELKGYEDLASPKWAGRLCLRTSQSAYNEALVGGLIETHGLVKATAIVDGWVKNLATDPISGDTGVLEAIASGVCDVGITNTYYLGQMIAKQPAFPVKAFFADPLSSGVYGNGTGAGVAVTSKQKELATRFIELLLSDKNQLEMSSVHFDYPAKMGLLPTTLVKDWGVFKYNDSNWSVVGSRAAEARDLMKAVQYK